MEHKQLGRNLCSSTQDTAVGVANRHIIVAVLKAHAASIALVLCKWSVQSHILCPLYPAISTHTCTIAR